MEGGRRGGFPGFEGRHVRFGGIGWGAYSRRRPRGPRRPPTPTRRRGGPRGGSRIARRRGRRGGRGRAWTRTLPASAEGRRGGGEGAGSWSGGRARREIRWTRRRAHLRGLDEVRLHELGHPVRAERRALIAVRPRPRGRGGVRLPARYRVHARGGLTRSDSNRPPGARMQSPSRIAMASADRRDVSSAAPFSARGTPSRGSLRARHSARARWAFEPPGSRASRCRVATSPSRWSSRCSRRPSRARPPTRASSSTRPPPPASSGAPSSCRAPRDA